MRRASLLRFFLLVAIVVRVAGAEIRIATLNCYLFFDPAVEHRTLAAHEERLTHAQYAQKVANLSTLVRGYQLVGLEETGGEREIATLAAATGTSWAWVPGTDTATGEEVGVLYHLPGWHVGAAHREPALERIVSKHLALDVQRGAERVHFLVVHLVRPLNTQSQHHRRQIDAIGRWMRETAAHDPGSVVVVLGDTNSTLTFPGRSLFGVGEEAGEHVGFAATHLSGNAYDRLVLFGPARWSAVEIRRPPYGNRPPAGVKRVWTDHYLLGATLDVR